MRNTLLPFQGPRLIFFMVIMFSTLAALLLSLFDYQVNQNKKYEAAAEENSVQSVPLPAPRGVIYDRYGVPLALNVAAYNVSIVPAYLPDDQKQALDVLNRLSALIDVPATRAAADAAGKKNIRSLEEMVKEGAGIAPYREVIVASDIKKEIFQQILEDKQNLPGVDVGFGPVRLYPSGALTSQIVGYLGPIGAKEAEELRAQGYNPAFERVGYAGIEAYLDDDLAGQRGLKTQVVDVAGLPVRLVSQKEPIPGKNVRLTIDLALQQGAQDALTALLRTINTEGSNLVSDSGVVIAMDPRTGQVLAMVSWPTYDNTQFARAINAEYYFRVLEDPQLPLVNHAVSSLYPPGSTWKVITATGVAQEKVIAPFDNLYDPGELFVQNSFAPNDTASRQRFVCWDRKGHGDVNLIKGIAWSCDVYFYQVGGGNPAVSPTTLKEGGLGIQNLDRYATMYGIGVPLGIELPGEVEGRMPDSTWKRRIYGESWSTGDTYNAAFGQGYVTVTPLQLINAVTAIANGGTLYQPTLISSFVDSQGNVTQQFTPQVARTIVMPTNGSPVVLNMREDFYLQGKNSLSCICEADSPYDDPKSKYYDSDPNRPKCSGDFIKNYMGTFNRNGQAIQYSVNVPYGYSFGGLVGQLDICDPVRLTQDDLQNYQPPFVDPINLGYIQEGMREAVTDPGGTAYVSINQLDPKIALWDPAGKTGTAEYCDNIANKKGLCIPGGWPAHAWFVAYAPFENPEIAVAAFVYNGGEGAFNALPIVKNVINCYFILKDQRSQLGGNATVGPCPVPIIQHAHAD